MKTTILRIYMPISARAKGKLSIWQKLFTGTLANFLAKKAKEQGIEQVVLQRIQAGYMNSQKLAFEGSEVSPPNLPLCVEMIDTETKLKKFITDNKEQLSDCRCVLFTGIVL